MNWLANDAWFGDDKVSHLGWGAFGAGLLLTAGVGFWTYWLSLLAAAVAVEVVELIRYRRWEAHGRRGSWPFMTDLFSYKDVVWGLGGGVLAFPLTLLARLL